MSWYHIPGNEQDAVISTRIRFARNLATYPFPSRLDAPRAKEIVNLVGSVLEKNGFSLIEEFEENGVWSKYFQYEF